MHGTALSNTHKIYIWECKTSVPRRQKCCSCFHGIHQLSISFFTQPLPAFPPLAPSNPHCHLSCSVSWLVCSLSSRAANAARANTCQEHCDAGFPPGLLEGGCPALPWWLRHTLRGHEEWREAQPVNVIPTAHAGLSRGKEHYWGWYWKLQKTNKRNQMFPTLALCKPHASLRVQPDRSLQLALNRIYLDLLHFYQENGDCGISLLSTCSPGPLIAYASGPNTPGKNNITQNWRVHLAWMHLSRTQLNWNSLLQIASWLQRTLQKRSTK